MSYAVGVILLVLDLIALISVFKSSASGGAKLAWAIGIIIFPLVGLVVWFLAGPKGSAAIA